MAKRVPQTLKKSRTIVDLPTPAELAGDVLPTPDAPSDSTRADEEKPDFERISIPIDRTTGKIAENAMRDGTKSRLRDALHGSSLLNGAAPTADTDPSAAMIVNVLYDLLGSAAVIFARSRLGASAAAAEAMRYTDQEKALFAAPTMKVLAKYDLMGGKYADEIALLVAVGGVTAAHYMTVQRIIAAEKVTTEPDKVAA
jgi:hypothetical protein